MFTNYKISEITPKEAKALISKYHYLGSKGFRSKVCFGLFKMKDVFEYELVGCAVYHDVSAPETVVGAFGLERNQQEGILELGRMVLRPDHNGGNFGSFLIGRTLRELRKMNYKYVISYASSDLHKGYLYQATNWKYYGGTTEKKDFYIELEDGSIKKQERGKTKGIAGVWLNRPMKHRYAYKLQKKLDFDMLWTEQPYDKGDNGSDGVCVYCRDSKIVVDNRFNKEYTCICQ